MERFASPERVWYRANSKDIGNLRILYLNFKKKSPVGEMVLSGEQSIRIFAEDFSKFTYFKRAEGNPSIDSLKRKLGLTKVRLIEGCNEFAKRYTTFIGDMELKTSTNPDGILVHIAYAECEHSGFSKTLTIEARASRSKDMAISNFWNHFNSRFPGCNLSSE